MPALDIDCVGLLDFLPRFQFGVLGVAGWRYHNLDKVLLELLAEFAFGKLR